MEQKTVFKKIEESFFLANQGREAMNTIVFYWGLIGYLVAYFIINKSIYFINIRTIDALLSLITISYFVWHIFILFKAKPKKIELTDEEKKLADLAKKEQRSKVIMRKLLLREPIFKWNTVSVVTAMDLLCIAHFSSFLFR